MASPLDSEAKDNVFRKRSNVEDKGRDSIGSVGDGSKESEARSGEGALHSRFSPNSSSDARLDSSGHDAAAVDPEKSKQVVRQGIGAQSHRIKGQQQREERLEEMQGLVKSLLECIGVDFEREDLLDTPMRYARTLLALTKGYQLELDAVVNGALFPVAHESMVVVKDIAIHSLCEHHLLPFAGKMHIGYIPTDKVIGLSKLPRITEMFSQRLQIQERLADQVADAVMKVTNAQGVGVIVEAAHLCVAMRGVNKANAKTITNTVRGCFADDANTRQEFMSLVGMNRK